MTVSVSGQKRALNSLTQGPARFRASVQRAAHIAGTLLVQKTRTEIMNGTKSGRMYGGHQASAPGEYSAFLTGAHLQSVDYRVQGPWNFEFGAGMHYSPFLELGTSKMEPREDLGQSVRSEQSAVTRALGWQPYVALSR